MKFTLSKHSEPFLLQKFFIAFSLTQVNESFRKLKPTSESSILCISSPLQSCKLNKNTLGRGKNHKISLLTTVSANHRVIGGWAIVYFDEVKRTTLMDRIDGDRVQDARKEEKEDSLNGENK